MLEQVILNEITDVVKSFHSHSEMQLPYLCSLVVQTPSEEDFIEQVNNGAPPKPATRGPPNPITKPPPPVTQGPPQPRTNPPPVPGTKIASKIIC